IVGLLGMLFLRPLAAASEWVGAQMYDPDGVLALAAFSSIFKFAGIAVFLPFIDAFSRLIVRISGTGSDSAVSRLEPALADAGAPAAPDGAGGGLGGWARGAAGAAGAGPGGERGPSPPPGEAVQQTEPFLEPLSPEPPDLGPIGPRLVRLAHALDHLTHLQDD